MARFIVQGFMVYHETSTFEIIVDADSADEAEEKVYSGDFDDEINELKEYDDSTDEVHVNEVIPQPIRVQRPKKP